MCIRDSRAAVDAEELGDGQLQVAELRLAAPGEPVETDQRLHSALAETPFAEDQAAPIILDLSLIHI